MFVLEYFFYFHWTRRVESESESGIHNSSNYWINHFAYLSNFFFFPSSSVFRIEALVQHSNSIHSFTMKSSGKYEKKNCNKERWSSETPWIGWRRFSTFIHLQSVSSFSFGGWVGILRCVCSLEYNYWNKFCLFPVLFHHTRPSRQFSFILTLFLSLYSILIGVDGN